MLKLAVDEDFDNDVLRGLLRREPELDVRRMQDAGLVGAKDAAVLEWAATSGRVLLTHDANTMTKFAYERVRTGLPMPGVLVVTRNAPFTSVLDDILLLVNASNTAEWEGQVLYVPL